MGEKRYFCSHKIENRCRKTGARPNKTTDFQPVLFHQPQLRVPVLQYKKEHNK